VTAERRPAALLTLSRQQDYSRYRKFDKWEWSFSSSVLVSWWNCPGCRRQLIIPSVLAFVQMLKLSMVIKSIR